MRAALYARYSSDLQNERSAEDQLAALRIVAAAKGWIVAREYADAGMSGATLGNRPGAVALLADAPRGLFDVVMTEALDRLSRDQEDIAHLFKRLRFAGVVLETLSSGRVSSLHIGLEGTMNQMFLEELAKKTRRGLVARVQAGFSGGGRCYGYRSADEKGVLEIDAGEAETVRRIFTDYDRGLSPRSIAQALNREAVNGPRGGQWTAATINGDRRAQDGILHQELYVGVRVFNRRRFRKHPETGRRSSVLNPSSEWIRRPAPELRILDDALWRKVQARKSALSETPGPRARRPKRLLSGLLRCGLCGGAMTLQGPRYACSSHRERGICTNARIVAAATVEARVLDGLREKLLAPDVIAHAVRAYHDDMAAEAKAGARDRGALEREAAEMDRRIARLVQSVEEGAPYSSVKSRMIELEARKAEIQALQGAQAKPAYRIHPKAAEHYSALVAGLAMALEGDDALEAREALRGLIDKVTFTPADGRGNFALEVHGRLGALLGENKTPGSEVMVGAGTRSIRNLTSLDVVFAA